ncbi:CRISPR-associated protein Cas4 [Pasteurella bettyae]|uniref:CRISPR-associated exonuclease Cas4 n=1 Tax=Pasteurella bettyae CCUG 2042 TaxID=1095749 RepID=I3DIS2_9PAST|nr:CRISPR-associated protein Cas4 [Pasteurella bettyae]EIJ71615.1 CRISPR-associated protein Cas4 [Pasteurella bettyae CCUG 2042]SUB21582.1 CRISPR-associated protein Cas4 [Pasteurella bettyae]
MPISLSALQHYAFCPRQCALIHNEQLWAENFLTAQGNILHERVDSGEPETRKGVRFERAVLVSSEKLDLAGKLDLLEVELSTGQLRPVEYKRGKPKPTNWDKIQLCSQAICLEEMKGIEITEGALWYGQTRHREIVPFSTALRTETLQAIEAVQTLLASGVTPQPVYAKRCKACSLMDLCQPQLLQKDRSKAYIEQLFTENDDA